MADSRHTSGQGGDAPAGRPFTAGARALPLAEAARRFGVAWDEEARAAAVAAARRLPLRFPEPYADLVRPGDPADPLLRLAWPDPEELSTDPGALPDPVGEAAVRPHPALVRKYRDRALLLLTSRCHFYCRFCFRAGAGADPSPEEIEAAIASLAGEQGIREVILSGGDPLVLPDAYLAWVLRRLSSLPQLAAVRLHTRAPVHDPQRVTADLVRALSDASPAALWIAVHTSHPRELTPAFRAALWQFLKAGMSLLNQTVLLRGVNADPETLAELFTGLYARQVKPYYLHHPDRIAGTGRFRVTIPEGLAVYRALRERVTAPALPAYVLDLPDGSGKVPVEALVRTGQRRYEIEHRGRRSVYEDFA